MSFGCCPLTSDIEENRDVIKNDAYSFKSKDVKDLKAKLEFMLKNPKQVKAKGIRCKSIVKKKYDWPTIAKQTLEVYKKASRKK